jgi:hypothetical protein
MAPELVSLVLDEFNKGDQKSPLQKERQGEKVKRGFIKEERRHAENTYRMRTVEDETFEKDASYLLLDCCTLRLAE